MDKELKTKWVAALRSGDYKQGVGYLHRNGEYCCLGVLGKILGFEDEPLSAFCTLSFFLQSLDPNADPLMDSKIESELVNMNDGLHKTFPQIADYIEVTL